MDNSGIMHGTRSQAMPFSGLWMKPYRSVAVKARMGSDLSRVCRSPFGGGSSAAGDFVCPCSGAATTVQKISSLLHAWILATSILFISGG